MGGQAKHLQSSECERQAGVPWEQLLGSRQESLGKARVWARTPSAGGTLVSRLLLQDSQGAGFFS